MYTQDEVSPAYKSLSDTSDRNYWVAGKVKQSDRTQRFTPKDPELHRQLKRQAWEKIPARLPKLKAGHV